ncbi:MAG TPA: zinc ribbon domain-containing protein [Stellaceae bacterium]|nr:zinc ribbon domain-containing protein [Stellaceae bacterium]
MDPPITPVTDHADGSGHRIVIYQYGLKPPLDWGADCEAEVDRMRAFWNKLVEIERGHRAAVFAVSQDDDRVKALSLQAEAAREELATAKEQRAKLRQAARRKVRTDDLDAAITDLRERYGVVAAQLKEARAAVRAASRDRLAALNDARKAAVKAARQSSGCFWGNYNAVIASYETGRNRAIKANGELRFRSVAHRDCRIVNQIQGGGAWNTERAIGGQVVIRPHDLVRRRHGRPRPEYRLSLTIYTRDRQRRTVTWPMILDRPIPSDARIQEVVVTRRDVERRERWYVSFLCRVPEQPISNGATETGQACGIDVGWRRMSDGVRVATIVGDDGSVSYVTLPERIIDGLRYADDITSDIDNRVNARVAHLKVMTWTGMPTELSDLLRPMLLAASRVTAGMLGRLISTWRGMTPQWQPGELADALRDVQFITARRRERAGLLLRLSRARRDYFRKELVAVMKRYRLIGIEQISIAALARRENNPTPKPSRWYRRAAAPGEFLNLLRHVAVKTGARVHVHSDKSTWVCAHCGNEHVPREPAELIVRCSKCGSVWDQDINAARNILAATVTRSDVAHEPIRSLEGKKTKNINTGRETRWRRAKRFAIEKEEKE